jgi:hypothetical protein
MVLRASLSELADEQFSRYLVVEETVFVLFFPDESGTLWRLFVDSWRWENTICLGLVV